MKGLAMHGCVWWTGSAAIAISLCTLSAGAVGTSRMVQFAQNVSDAGRGITEPSQPPVANESAALPANSPEQIRKAQTELRRLDCLKGRIDGKLGDQTRQAVKKFWASAKQPAVEVNITDELISDLAARGDLFCRPVRPFFGFGGRSGGNSARLPLLAPGARPGPVPPAAAPPLSPAAEH
jgi:peptidoglycan hydrolase-like protein with peptidoglycan-binding domain